MKKDDEIRVTDWDECVGAPWYPSLKHGGYMRYRIYTLHDGMRWFQRHEWQSADGTIKTENWIPTTSGWPVSAKRVDIESESL